MKEKIDNIISKVNNSIYDENINKYRTNLGQEEAVVIIKELHKAELLTGFTSKSSIKEKMSEWFENNCEHNPLNKDEFVNYSGRSDTEFAQKLGNIISNLKKDAKEILSNGGIYSDEKNELVFMKIGKEYYIKPIEDIFNSISLDKNDANNVSEKIRRREFKIRREEGDNSETLKVVITNGGRDRDGVIAELAKSTFKNLCPLHKDNPELTSFLTKDDKFYVEGHHIIPYSVERKEGYKNSIDDVWNIIPLCPKCHKLIHNGLDQEKVKIIKVFFREYVAVHGISFLDVFNDFLEEEGRERMTEESLVNYLLREY